MSGAAMISLCPLCADRISKIRDLEEVSKEFMGHCGNCRQYNQLTRYEVGMTHAELERRRRARTAAEKTKKVSGERGRAERRAR